jgi:membrane protein DedA with SNARE-associated domain
MLAFLVHAVERYGYFAVALFVTLEGFGIPLPGETAVVTAAAFAARGPLSIVGVALSASLGTLLGGTGGYWIGQHGGRRLLVRYGHWIRLDAARLARTEAYFARHGAKTVFLARFVALLRILGPVLAGIAHMPFVKFSVVNLAGGILWAVTFSAVGYAFGRNLPRLEHMLGRVSLLIMIVVIALVVYFVKARRKGAEAL